MYLLSSCAAMLWKMGLYAKAVQYAAMLLR
jgi:hypothetical protein